MARDGGGVYSKPAGSTAVVGAVIEAAPFNTLVDDIVSDLNIDRPVVAGGTGASTAAAARTNLGISAPLSSVDTTGSANAYLYTSGSSLTPSNGDVITIVANHANTGAATIDVDGTGALNWKKTVNGTPTALATGDVHSGGHYMLAYDLSETAWVTVNATFSISGQTALGTAPVAADHMSVYDASAADHRKATIQELYDATSNLTAETAPALADVLPIYDASNTGARKMTFQNLLTTTNLLTEDTDPDLDADFVPVYDTSTSTMKKVLLTNTGGFGALRGTAITTTSGTSHSFTSLPAALNQIVIMIAGVSLAAHEQLAVRLGDAGGFESSGYNTCCSEGTTNSNQSSAGGFFVTTGALAGFSYTGIITLNRIDGNTWLMEGKVAQDGANARNLHVSAGKKTLSAELTQVRLYSSGGAAFDSGTFNILY